MHVRHLAPLGFALLSACSVSMKTAHGPTKPAGGAAHDAAEPAPAQKPITSKPSAAEEEGPDDAAGDGGDGAPTRPGGASPGALAEPEAGGPRAICRIPDPQVQSLCHRAFDPIAADDATAFLESLSQDVVFVRPGADGEPQRLAGPAEVRRALRAAGGVRELMHAEADRRIVGTLIKDCRKCGRAFVAFEANTRAGAVLLTMDTGSSPALTRIELRAEPVRRQVGVRSR